MSTRRALPRRLGALMALGLIVAACTSAGDTESGGSVGGDGDNGSGESGNWHVVELVDDQVGDTLIEHRLNSMVTGIWFGDATHGAVALYGFGQTSQAGGAVLSMSGPETVEGVAARGFGNGFDGQNASFVALFDTPIGLIAGNTFGSQFFISTDKGRSFTNGPSSVTGTPNSVQYWFSKDTAGVWHLMDGIGNVWFATTDPGPTTTWTRTWQPNASPPEPPELPEGACPFSFRQGYYAFDAQQAFWVSTDGGVMMYGSGYGTAPAGVCRSSDGGASFYPVAFPDPPAGAVQGTPYVIVFSDDSHGMAARSSDLEEESGYVYVTEDAGATWTKGALPAAVNAPRSRTSIVSGACVKGGTRCWLVGNSAPQGSNQPLLLRTDDGGATWEDLSAGLFGLPDIGFVRLHTVFALDENEVWIGGIRGVLLHSSTGGE